MSLLDLVVTISAEDKASTQIQGLSTRAVAMGSAIGTTVGGLVSAGVQKAADAVIEFGKESIETGMTFDSAMSQVAATMGVTTADIQDLTNTAKEMGATTSFSATEAAEALNYMALAGYDSETSMSMLPNVLNLAAAGAMDLGAASDMVTDTQTALGLSIEQTNTLVDQMAKTASSSNTSVSQLGDAILTVGGTAKNLSGGMTEMNTVLGVLADNGIKGSEAGTHLRNMILSLTAPTDVAAQELERLGISATDSAGNMRPLEDVMQDFNVAFEDMTAEEKTQALNKIFNKTDLASVNALLDTSVDRWEELGNEIMHASVSVDEANAAVENSGVAWEKYADSAWMANGGIEGLANEMIYNIQEVGTSAEELEEYLQFEYDLDAEDAKMAVEALQGSFENAQGAAQAMADTQLDNLAGDVTLFQSALEGVQIELANGATPSLRDLVSTGSEGLSQMAAQLQSGDLVGGFETLGTTVANVASVFLENLPTFIDAGLKMLGGFIKGFAEGLPTMIPSLVAAIIDIVDAIIANIPLFIDAAIQLINGLVQGILQSLPVLVEKLPEVITTIINALVESIPILIDGAVQLVMGVVEALPTIIQSIIEALPMIIEAIVTGLLEYYMALVDGFIQLFTAVVENLPLIIETMITMAPMIIESLVTAFMENGPKIIEAFVKIFTELPAKIWEFLSMVIENVGKWAVEMGGKALEAGGQFLENVVKFISELPGKIAEFCANIINNIINWVKDMNENSIKASRQFLENVVKFFSELPGKIADFCSDIINGIVNWVSDMIENAQKVGSDFFNAINQWFGDVINFFMELPGKIINAIGDAGRMLLDVGRNIIQGLIDGIVGAVSGAIDAVTGAIGGIIDAGKRMLGIASPSKVFASIGDFTMQGLAKGFEEGSVDAANTLEDVLEDMSDNSLAIGIKGTGNGGSIEADRKFVFNVTINSSQDAMDYGRKIGESLYETMQRMELSFA